ncbi:uncharacterized protein LY79DRAFT_396980 [Colletotrichum navitas]|uniref:Uncharacterized protein n=1 Tax=Colletotrichum navitas TaxID=681940 RepID=A0AAD8V0Z7_9PEZI|nr:uncharacterized protein LY79DRAFT_396980 [Colletotrichum navitas]KAK1573794.1 hypothetical protein LY79DRAFT_396980 [Colletotrichum navitas]
MDDQPLRPCLSVSSRCGDISRPPQDSLDDNFPPARVHSPAHSAQASVFLCYRLSEACLGVRLIGLSKVASWKRDLRESPGSMLQSPLTRCQVVSESGIPPARSGQFIHRTRPRRGIPRFSHSCASAFAISQGWSASSSPSAPPSSSSLQICITLFLGARRPRNKRPPISRGRKRVASVNPMGQARRSWLARLRSLLGASARIALRRRNIMSD